MSRLDWLTECSLVELKSKSFDWKNDFEFNSTNLRSSKPIESVHRLMRAPPGPLKIGGINCCCN